MTKTSLLNNRYQLEERLGSGGMAVVYKGRDLMLERTVAIKVLRKDFSNDPAFRERFRQEAKAAANLTHPNIVTVHDFGIDQGRIFIFHGDPDRIDSMEMDASYPGTWQIWYYRDLGLLFRFYDAYSMGDYRLYDTAPY